MHCTLLCESSKPNNGEPVKKQQRIFNEFLISDKGKYTHELHYEGTTQHSHQDYKKMTLCIIITVHQTTKG